MDDKPLTSANVRAFLARPWKELEERKRLHWAAAFAADAESTFRASEAMWELLHQTGHTTDANERRADLEAHLRLRSLLDRAGNVRPR